MCAFKLSMESQMETLDTGECGNGGYKLFFSLIQHSLLLGKKKKKKVDSRFQVECGLLNKAAHI